MDYVSNLLVQDNYKELEGLIYVYQPYLTRAPQQIGDIVFIHNDSYARNQLKLLATSSPEFKHQIGANSVGRRQS